MKTEEINIVLGVNIYAHSLWPLRTATMCLGYFKERVDTESQLHTYLLTKNYFFPLLLQSCSATEADLVCITVQI